MRGAEADFAALLFNGFTLRASVAYADGENTDYPAGPCPLEVQSAATVACDLTGVPLAGLSDWVGTLGFDYEIPMGTGEFLIHVDSNSRSGYYSDTSASQYTWIDGYNVTNACVGYRFKGGWEANVWARNVFDSDYIGGV